MKTILVFSLPDEREELDIAMKGSQYLSKLEELSESLRAKDKYDAPPPKDWAEVREMFFEIVGELP